MKAIIIGAGPSLFLKNHFELLKDSQFSGIVVIPDVLICRALQAGIIPDKFQIIVTTLEDEIHTKTLMNYDIVKKWGKSIDCFISARSPIQTESFCIETFRQVKKIERSEINNTSNVGLFSLFVIFEEMNINHICMIGMDHATAEDEFTLISKESEIFKNAFKEITNPNGTKCVMNPIQQLWRVQFMHYLEQYLYDVDLINCTEGGSLFGEKIQSMEFSEWLEANRF